MLISNNKIIRLCVFLTILTSSFDVFLNLQIAGLSFRFSQFVILPVILFWIADGSLNRSWKIKQDDIWLIAWVVIQFCFIFRSPNLNNAMGYWLWLLLNTLTVLSIQYFCGKAYSFNWLMRTYLDAFAFVGGFGLLQFVAYPLGVNLLVTQAWFAGKLARINGFCYEPSYFSTYMLAGFIILAYLAEFSDQSFFTKKELQKRQLVVTAAIILTSSRMGWLMVGGYIALRVCRKLWRVICYGAKKRKVIRFAGILVVAVIVAVGMKDYILKKYDLSFLLNGLGILGLSAHSSSDRIDGLKTCLDIFEQSPLLGYSLGGVDPIIAQYKGITYDSSLNGMAMSVAGELLVANGIVGIIPFLIYMWKMFYKGCRSKIIICKALAWAFVFEMAILCMNQNILRIYVWVLFAVVRCAIDKCQVIDNMDWAIERRIEY